MFARSVQLTSLLLTLALASCFSRIQRTDGEKCAAYGMAAHGAACVKPASQAEHCTAMSLEKSNALKVRYNRGVTWKKWVTLGAHFVYLIPGIVINIAFRSQRRGVVEEAEESQRITYAQCMQSPSIPSPRPTASQSEAVVP